MKGLSKPCLKIIMIPDRITYLIVKHLQGTASDEEIGELQHWYSNTDLSEVVLKDLTREELEQTGFSIGQKLQTHRQLQKKSSLFAGRWWQVAAVCILFIGVIWWWNYNANSVSMNKKLAAIKNLQPGHSGAVLHLDDGRTILLDSTSNGLIAAQSGVEIVRDSSGIQYKGTSTQPSYNTVTTEKGRVWSLVLPDGTKAWLNSASSIRFPLSFTGGERLVEVTGEAYFEVVHDAKMPFKVKVADQVIEDLGTSFNINAYGDNQNVITTLVQGSLRIDSKAMKCVLIPGQQARIGKDNIICEVSRMETVTSWREGYFDFYDAGLREMLQQISRWYNFEVRYASGLTNEKFTGRFPKDMTLGKALEVLRQAGINFTVEPGEETNGKSVIVSPMQ